ncbi:MAG: sigma-54 dependent transcriptional regulator [Desulfarculaceae bacterium]|nr:sigma-54 dependent transcriptional regulator [Desulfarculaceae bacterium]MCF8073799.1 sigma-54 dependent transcriptional regulator [Desulfarculaceae bacterium]MCF8102040.1 sigma-54 dependent transcriptional regulator [Desulfarculaceae bacterium]MCF8116010.1 sigma-54 dependent transcriptional regulator [Desulfarculaceae bacterium]
MAASGPLSILLVARTKSLSKRYLEWLESPELSVNAAADPDEALALADQSYFDLVFLADHLGGKSTGPFLERLVEAFPETVVTVLSEQPSAGAAVEALHRGAFNFLPAPEGPEELLAAVKAAREHRSQRRRRAQRRRRDSVSYDVENLVGTSRAMQEVFRLIHKVAPTDSTVLILGESGTGKELVARAIHHHSPRRESPLVTVNCGAIPGELLESELFGHEKGAFTGAVRTRVGRFELAQGGTIFLDEIGDMPPLLQVKILRVLQEHAFERVGGTRTIEVDLRVLAATNQDLTSRVQDGHFREDLYYRLNVVPIEVPPLRERKSDIPLLCDFFLERLAKHKGLEHKELAPEVRERLLRYAWPGNVRELENLLERLVVLAEGGMITPEALPAKLDGEALPPDTGGDGRLTAVELPPGGLNLKSTLEQLEARLIAQALEQADGVKAQAASLLGLNRTTLVQKLKKLGEVRYRGTSGPKKKKKE